MGTRAEVPCNGETAFAMSRSISGMEGMAAEVGEPRGVIECSR